MKARILNEHGISEFHRYIMKVRAGETGKCPLWMLDNERTSQKIGIDIELNSREFASRYEMGEYLVSILDEENFQVLIGHAGFWSWLALYWFDQLCPAKSDGLRKPSMPHNYILSDDYRHRSRHAIYMTWQLVKQYGEVVRFMLNKEMSSRGELVEQMMARQDIPSLEGVIQLASKLYTDTKTGGFKRGAASRKSGGCVARLVSWIQQLDLTFDLYSITSDELVSMMPKEFDRFT